MLCDSHPYSVQQAIAVKCQISSRNQSTFYQQPFFSSEKDVDWFGFVLWFPVVWVQIPAWLFTSLDCFLICEAGTPARPISQVGLRLKCSTQSSTQYWVGARRRLTVVICLLETYPKEVRFIWHELFLSSFRFSISLPILLPKEHCFPFFTIIYIFRTSEFKFSPGGQIQL